MSNLKIDFDKLEGKVRQNDGSFICMCPACAEQGLNLKKKDHLRIWPTNQFNCVIDNSREHNKRILHLLGVDVGDQSIENYIRVEEKVEVVKQWDISILKGLIPNHSYWNGRGISDATCNYFKIGLALKGQLNARSVIPIIDKNNPNKIIGFTGRTIRPKEKIEKYNIVKWKHLGEKDKWLMPAIDEEIIKAKSVILVESPGCFLSLFEYGIKNTICLFGVNISSAIMGYLLKLNPDKILVATNNEPDNNNIGNKSADKIIKQLLQFFNSEKIIKALPYKKDFNEMTIDDIGKYKKEFLT